MNPEFHLHDYPNEPRLRDMPRTMESLPYFQTISDLSGLISVSTLPAGLPVADTGAVPPTPSDHPPISLLL